MPANVHLGNRTSLSTRPECADFRFLTPTEYGKGVAQVHKVLVATTGHLMPSCESWL